MIDIALDPVTKDLQIKDFDLVLIDDTLQIMQNLLIRLRFVFGEWFLDITQGIPYYEDFFKKAPNIIRMESVLKDMIVTTEGVTQILSFSSDFNSSLRTYSVNFTAETISGEQLAVEEELI